jgi:hypothetical protein
MTMSSNGKIKINLDSLKSRKEWKRHRVKDGHNIYRILPPFGDASNGYPFRKWQIVWGLVDPESGRARPYADSMIAEKRSPIVEFVDELKSRAETMGTALTAKGASSEEVTERLKGINQLIGDLVPRTSYVYNACDKAGEVGLLELKATAHKDMKDKMNKYIQDYNQDPTSLNSADDDSGVWFDVIRSNETGKFRDTKYSVEKVQMKVKNAAGKVSFEDDRSPLPDAVVENYDNLGYDLSAIYQQKSYDDLKGILDANMSRIVELCPDADLTVEPSIGSASPLTKSTKTPVPAKTGAGKINVRLDDVDTDAPTTTQSTRSTTKLQTNALSGDDFLAEADRILNS